MTKRQTADAPAGGTTAASTTPPTPADIELAALLALDWGTSSLRAFLLDGRGHLMAERHSERGLMHLAHPGVAGFEHALGEVAGDWLRARPGLPAVACGMVGSAKGWREAPYVPCPVDTRQLAAQGCWVDSASGSRVLIAPGVLHDPDQGYPDVMRGEETQIAGALALHPEWAGDACIVLPGTHAKWARIEGGRITSFWTCMTGELYAVLRQHSLLGQTMSDVGATADEAAAAFACGLALARRSQPGELTHQLFAVRTLGLRQRIGAGALPDFLSGLLIGHELVYGLGRLATMGAGAVPLLLAGDVALSRRYARAFEALGHPPAAVLGNTAALGLYHFALAAGLPVGGMASAL
jgi:2-dehydro-3-deoxygalactonokinase